ncbi:MAG: uridine diphosphate-N-acetylglucosamine-binding protein YvcK [Polyangiaceae bacterium]|nr:uridine diphosphate-N-acetylglucosamine-binding protein YvcK [Polyangiaceae bacterium]
MAVGRSAEVARARRERGVAVGPRIVAIGGGTGLSATLSGLKTAMFAGERRQRAREDACLTAIVNVVDDGGSSGRLRAGSSLPAPGDVRRCLVALAACDPMVSALFEFRFAGTDDVGGHSLGNLVIAALSELGGGDFHRAVALAGKLLHVRGRVLPCTDDDVALAAELEDGTWVEGESQIPRARGRIQRVHLHPSAARALPESCDAVREADLVVIGPGSVYTSLIPPLLLGELRLGIAHSHAPVVLVANLMTEPGETDGHSVADMVRAILSHAPSLRIDHVLVNRTPFPASVVASYRAAGAVPVELDRAALRALGCEVVEADLAAPGHLVRHDPVKLGQAILALLPAATATPSSEPSHPCKIPSSRS